MKERSYAQPESAKLITQTTNKLKESLDISNNQLTGIDNAVKIALNRLRTASESATQGRVIAVDWKMGHGEFA